MAEFIVELYQPRLDERAMRRREREARSAAGAVSRAGSEVRFEGSIFVPTDETCFFLYEADNADAVRAAASEAGLAFDRVVEAVTRTSRRPRRPIERRAAD